MTKKDLDKIINQIGELTVLELAELVKTLEERFGVSATIPQINPTDVKETTEKQNKKDEAEKDNYDVILVEGGGEKIKVIKVVRELKPELGLKDAKTLVDEAPKTLLEGAKKEAAEEAKKKLEEVGAKVELK